MKICHVYANFVLSLTRGNLKGCVQKNSTNSFDHEEDSLAYSEKITPSTSQKILTCTTGKEGYFVMSVLTWACSPIAANTLITTLGSWSLNLGISAWKIYNNVHHSYISNIPCLFSTPGGLQSSSSSLSRLGLLISLHKAQIFFQKKKYYTLTRCGFADGDR